MRNHRASEASHIDGQLQRIRGELEVLAAAPSRDGPAMQILENHVKDLESRKAMLERALVRAPDTPPKRTLLQTVRAFFTRK